MKNTKMIGSERYNGVIWLPEDLQKVYRKNFCLGFPFLDKQFCLKKFLSHEDINSFTALQSMLTI